MKRNEKMTGQRKKMCFLLFMLFCVLPVLSACVSLAREDGAAGHDQFVGFFIVVELRNAKEQGQTQESDEETINMYSPKYLMEKKENSGNDGRVWGTINADTNEFEFEGMKGYSLGNTREEGDAMDTWEMPEEGSQGGGTFYHDGLNLSDLVADADFVVDWNEEKIEWKLSGSLFYDASEIGYTNCYSQEMLRAETDGGLKRIIMENGLGKAEGIDEVKTIDDLKAFTADLENILIEDREGIDGEKWIYVFVGNEIVFQIHQVYQTEQGEIYLLPGDGFSVGESGGSMYVMDEISEEGIGGQRITENYKVEISFEGISSPVEAITFSFYDGEKNLIDEEICRGSAIPLVLQRTPETAFIFVTQSHRDGSRSYDIIKPEDTAYQFCIEGSGPILRQKVVTIQ